MQIKDHAIIIGIRKTGENAAIFTGFSQEHGVIKGLIHGVSRKKDRGNYQPGNIVRLQWRARLEEQLGTVTIEDIITPIASLLLVSAAKLLALNTVLCYLNDHLQVGDPHQELYQKTYKFLSELPNQLHWQQAYLIYESDLLRLLGFGLELHQCAVTGSTEDLCYVSPNTGRAACKEAGKPYHSRLLPLPFFMAYRKENTGNRADYEHNREIMEGWHLTEYFIDKYLYKPYGKTMPHPRKQLSEYIRLKSKELIEE